MVTSLKSLKTTCLYLSLFAALTLVVCSCRSEKKKVDPTKVNFEASYNILFENKLYPSLVLALSNFVPDESLLSDKTSVFNVKATAPCNKAVFTLIIDSTPLNYTTKYQYVLTNHNQRYTFYPAIKWKFDKLYRIRNQGTIDLTFHCFINDEEVDVKNIRLNFRSANECLLSVKDTSGVAHDFRWMFTAYVNEEHPFIDSIMSDMLTQGVTRRFVGYQTSNSEVIKQVEAIWYYAVNRGMSYSSISTTSSPAKRANVQHIRFFEEVYKLRQANCIDACVFFASVMRKIGLKPIIFVIPGHAYLGYYTDRERTKLKLLETTMTQWVDLPALEYEYQQIMKANPEASGAERLTEGTWQMYSRYLSESERARWTNGTMNIDQLKHCLSHNLFKLASERNEKNYNDNIEAFYNREDLQYQLLDIEKSRQVVQPIGGVQ